MLLTEVKKFQAGNISKQVKGWEIITTDSYILDAVKNGIKMVFLTAPVCDFYPHKTHSKEGSDIIQAEFCEILNKVVIIPTERPDDDFVSKIFTRKKRDDRMILNLKEFNDILLLPHCKLESIEDTLNLTT